MKTRVFSFVAMLALIGFLGCGGHSSNDPGPSSFSLQVAPSTVSVVAGGTARSLTIGATPLNDFNGQISLKVGTLPAGVTATPMTLTLTPGTLQQIKITASGSATPGNGSISITGTSGNITQNASATVAIGPPGAAADFSLQAAPSTVSVTAGGTARSLTIGATALNGFTGDIAVQVGSLPAGVRADPMTFTITPGTLQQIKITASSAAAAGNGTISLTGTSGSITENGSAALAVAAAGPAGPAPAFSLQAAPSAVNVVAGGTARSLTVGATALNGFTGDIAVQVGSLPAGVTATPMTFTLSPGALQQVKITASGTAAAGSGTITLSGTSGTLSESASAALTVGPATTTASVSTTFFDFGNNLVNNSLAKSVATISNTGIGILTLNPTLSGDSSYSIGTGGSCGTQLAAGASCDMVVNYNPTTASSPHTQDATLSLGLGNVATGTPQAVALTGTSATLPPGEVIATNNPQVALYTMTLPFPGSVTINFGTDTNYGLKTWTQNTDTAGGKVSIFVAGMKATTQYHMQAAVAFSNGLTAKDADRTFTTKAIPANLVINQTTTTTPGMTPQPGLELLNPLVGTPSGIIITDLAGNTLWTYANPGTQTSNFIDGVKTLPNGHILMVIGPSSNVPLPGPVPADAITELREVDLAGNTVREISLNDLNSDLKTATCAECKDPQTPTNPLQLVNFHHDVEVLPNGHMILIANSIMTLSNTTTPVYNSATPTKIIGDVLVDLDENMKPAWVWNEFNHLDPNRKPYLFPDWTHTNAVVYSPDDGNLIVSIRHQNWLVKVNYANGSGAGNILWRMGQGGDLTLIGGTDPTDWMYAQHAPSFFSQNTSGVFSLGLMDNGDDRNGVQCSGTGCYTTVPVWQIDETAKTATFTFHQILPNNLYSNFGGNTQQLANKNVEYDLCGIGSGSDVFEVTQEATPQTVWHMHITGTNLYRAFRIPSLYPGVQW